jgi:hypothetical protein
MDELGRWWRRNKEFILVRLWGTTLVAVLLYWLAAMVLVPAMALAWAFRGAFN